MFTGLRNKVLTPVPELTKAEREMEELRAKIEAARREMTAARAQVDALDRELKEAPQAERPAIMARGKKAGGRLHQARKEYTRLNAKWPAAKARLQRLREAQRLRAILDG